MYNVLSYGLFTLDDGLILISDMFSGEREVRDNLLIEPRKEEKGIWFDKMCT